MPIIPTPGAGAAPWGSTHSIPIMSTTCLLAWALALLLLPVLLLAWILETQPERIRRLSRSGLSQRAIATRLGISRHRVARALA